MFAKDNFQFLVSDPIGVLVGLPVLGHQFGYVNILPLYAALEKMDGTLLEAASDLGCPPWKAFWKITFPLSLPGVVAGSMICFIPITGEFVIPDLLGGADTLMIGKTLWTEFSANRDWPLASAVAVILLLVLVTLPFAAEQADSAPAA